jgi:hypothetical protein
LGPCPASRAAASRGLLSRHLQQVLRDGFRQGIGLAAAGQGVLQRVAAEVAQPATPVQESAESRPQAGRPAGANPALGPGPHALRYRGRLI